MLSRLQTQDIDEIHGDILGACSVQKTAENMCEHDSLGASFSRYGPQDRLT
jgi:hypothetical protein